MSRELSVRQTGAPVDYFSTAYGRMVLGDSIEILDGLSSSSVDLIVTSPPFALVRKKDYGNADADQYLEWFRPFAEQFARVLKDSGSLVIDIGGSWNRGSPTRSLYHFKLVIMLVEEIGLHLAQEMFWWNPSKLPTPAEWVTVRRVRVKDAVNTVWWLAKTPWPKADNRRVLQPYSEAMKTLLRNGYRPRTRPSGHDISENFAKNNGASIPPNLLALPNTESNSRYLRYCQEQAISPHPARFPADLPEYFIRMLTDEDDFVVDPFAGSCVTGEVCERLSRRWLCAELEENYLKGALGRFQQPSTGSRPTKDWYRVPRPGLLWDTADGLPPLEEDGGRQYRIRRRVSA